MPSPTGLSDISWLRKRHAIETEVRPRAFGRSVSADHFDTQDELAVFRLEHAEVNRPARNCCGVVAVKIFLDGFVIHAEPQHAVVPTLRRVQYELLWSRLVGGDAQLDEVARLAAAHEQLTVITPQAVVQRVRLN